jgi:hypothetical protein
VSASDRLADVRRQCQQIPVVDAVFTNLNQVDARARRPPAAATTISRPAPRPAVDCRLSVTIAMIGRRSRRAFARSEFDWRRVLRGGRPAQVQHARQFRETRDDRDGANAGHGAPGKGSPASPRAGTALKNRLRSQKLDQGATIRMRPASRK